MKIPIFPGKYHQNGGFSMAMLVLANIWMSMALRFSFLQANDGQTRRTVSVSVS